MCGIAGFFDYASRGVPGEDATARIRRMCDVIAHRGPDDEGTRVEPGLALGMRRLSVIDLATGHQPMSNEAATVWVVFNGEIYNFVDLRRRLTTDGHRFRTTSDTEVIVHGYEQWGAGVFEQLHGMFAIAIWDARARTLLLARDRPGMKPLYYSDVRGRLYFGSEAKCLLVNPEVPREIDPLALDHYLAYLHTPGDRAIVRAMHKLQPGCYLRVDANGYREHRYWQMPIDRVFAGTEDEATDEVERVVAEAVRSHLVSDVPIGAFLSGGIDSSLVVALMAKASGRTIDTFSVGFEDPAYDERPHARQVADWIGTHHHELVVGADAVGALDRIIWHLDEPFADPSAIPTWFVSELARRHVTVVLSGDGGDELFGGYDRYLPHPRVAAFDRLAGRAGRAAAAAAWRIWPRGARGRNFLRHVARDAEGRYVDSLTFFAAEEREALLAPDFAIPAAETEALFRRPLARLADRPLPERMMAFDFETYLPDDCLVKVDRMSMAHSIESRVPLLDHRLVELAASVPWPMKISGSRRKHLLRQVAFRHVPQRILERPKQGFAVPLADWLRGPLRQQVGDILGSPRTRQRGYMNAHVVDRLVTEHLDGRRDHSWRVWQLLVFELWHRQFVDAAAPTVV